MLHVLVKVVFECRSSPTSKTPWDEVMKKLRGRDDFPSTFTKQDLKGAWGKKTGKPASLEDYENSDEARNNEKMGERVTAVCEDCSHEQKMWSGTLDKPKRCQGCPQMKSGWAPLKMFHRKDSTEEDSADE